MERAETVPLFELCSFKRGPIRGGENAVTGMGALEGGGGVVG